MNKTIPGEMDYVLAWVVFGVCTVVGVFVVAIVAGFAMGFVMGAMGASKEQIKLAVTIMGVTLWLPVSYVVFRLVTKGMLVGEVEVAGGTIPVAPSMVAPIALPTSGGVPPPLPSPMPSPMPSPLAVPVQNRETRPTLIAAEAILQEWKAKETPEPLPRAPSRDGEEREKGVDFPRGEERAGRDGEPV